MKQTITEEQLNELTDKQAQAIDDWYGDDEIDGTVDYGRYKYKRLRGSVKLPLLSIGQMIEYLEDQEFFESNCIQVSTNPIQTEKYIEWSFEESLCDKLWQAVKESL